MKNELNQHLHTRILVGWVAMAIALFGVATWVNGGFGFGRSTLTDGLLVLALAGSASFALCLIYLPRAQDWALRPGSDITTIRGELWFIALFAGSFGLGFVIDFCLRAVSA